MEMPQDRLDKFTKKAQTPPPMNVRTLSIASEYLNGQRQLPDTVSTMLTTDDMLPFPITMPEDFGNRLSLRARRILVRAQREAQQYQATHVGSEHLLLALLAEKEGPAAYLLVSLGVNADEISATVRNYIAGEKYKNEEVGPGITTIPAFQALEFATATGNLSWNFPVGSEHILLGLMQSEGIATGVLISHNLTLKKLEWTLAVLRGYN